MCVKSNLSAKKWKKIVKLCLAECSINCEVLPYLFHLVESIFGLLHAASATNERSISSQF